MRPMPLLPTLTLAALLLLPWTTSYATCVDDARIETLRSSISDPPDDDYERVVHALTLALEEGCTLRAQRDAAIAERTAVRTDRDRQAQRGDMLERRVGELERRIGESATSPPVVRSPWWMRRSLEAAIAAGGIATGAAIGMGAPAEILIAFAVFEGLALAGRFALAWLDDR